MNDLSLWKNYVSPEVFGIVQLLKHKKTGRIHCPLCLKETKVLEKVYYCKKCKKYYAKEQEKNKNEQED